MLFDTLDNLEMYVPALPKLRKVIEILDRGMPYEQEVGRYTTDDPDVTYTISSYMTSLEPKQFESHRVNTDVQIILEGQELMALTWREMADGGSGYDPKTDNSFCDGEPTVVINGAVGRFVVFFPGEPHKCCVAVGEPSLVRKVVFKINEQ